MKCNSRVVYKEARRKGSGKEYLKISSVLPYATWNVTGSYPDDSVICHGDIVADIRAVDEPDWGGCYARLQIEYKCDTCGNTYFPEFPNTDDELSLFMSNSIGSMSHDQRDTAIQAIEDERKAAEEYRNKLMEDMKARKKVR